MLRASICALIPGVGAALTWPALSQAAALWPDRPVRILVAYPPGGVSNDMARVLGQALAPRLGVPVVVENRPGAGGSLAMEALSRAPADGYTLCFSAITPLTLLPHLQTLPYDPQRDIAPVLSVMLTPVLVVATHAFTGRDLADVVTQARERPGALRWASSGHGTTGHFVLEQVRRAQALDITHVPYQGGGMQLNDALAGHFELLSTNVGPQQLQYVREGRLRPLAVGAPRRLPVLPDVPTLAELGFASANRASVFGLFAPGGTPVEWLDRLNAAGNAVLAEPAVRERMLAVSNLPTGGTREDFAREIAMERQAAAEALRP
ncbi:tripartite tricarboxylate transporter substrate binding protein [Hylemonella gracilis]|uniref:Tripartite tricarboxylate transporter substrate binding protein n=1 Tax=Hylemonella gracilis TaxID=80880 RepID=A0A4P6UMA9_9BURK|nr:tripartite tricarboxylate transporter substrate binding protein [Hylemonella gracilis]QBK06313.1 tripartite tricarboxylate transporter substrate binding protein [Hylemonella gracilis]